MLPPSRLTRAELPTLVPGVPQNHTVLFNDFQYIRVDVAADGSFFVSNFTVMITPHNNTDPFEVYWRWGAPPTTSRYNNSILHSNGSYSMVEHWPTPGIWYIGVRGARFGGNFTALATVSPSTFCSGTQVLTANSGLFTDGSGGADYLNSAACQFSIAPQDPDTTGIIVYFTGFGLETSGNCEFDCVCCCRDCLMS